MQLLKAKKAMVGKVIPIVIGCVLVGALIPTSIVQLTNANGNFTGATLAMWVVMPIIVIIGVLYMFLKTAGVKV